MKKEIVLILLLPACGGSQHKKKQLADNHCRQASLEVREYQEKNNVNALRKALNEVDQAININPTTHNLGLKGTILLQLGSIDQNANEIKESLKYFERILKNKKTPKAKRADAKNNYATALYQAGSTEEAKKNWHELTVNSHYISPEVAYFNLGYAELNEAIRIKNQQETATQEAIKNHLEHAATYFRQALAISREYIDALFFLAQTQVGLNHYNEAHNTVLTILTLNPDHLPAKTFLKRIEEKITSENIPESDR